MKLYRIAPGPNLGHQDRTFSDYRTCIFLELIAVQVLPDYHGMAHACRRLQFLHSLVSSDIESVNQLLDWEKVSANCLTCFARVGTQSDKTHIFDMFFKLAPILFQCLYDSETENSYCESSGTLNVKIFANFIEG